MKSYAHRKKYVPDFNYSNLKYCSESIVNDPTILQRVLLNDVKELPVGHQLILNFENKIQIINGGQQ